MINLDTERLQNMVELLQRATNDIDNANDILMSITTHSGWACKERYVINDYILENRKMIQTLQSECVGFCITTKSVVDGFVDEEKKINQMFSSVEAVIASILSNPVGSIIKGGSLQIAKRLDLLSIRKQPYIRGTIPNGIMNVLKKTVNESVVKETPIQVINLSNFDVDGLMR